MVYVEQNIKKRNIERIGLVMPKVCVEQNIKKRNIESIGLVMSKVCVEQNIKKRNIESIGLVMFQVSQMSVVCNFNVYLNYTLKLLSLFLIFAQVTVAT